MARQWKDYSDQIEKKSEAILKKRESEAAGVHAPGVQAPAKPPQAEEQHPQRVNEEVPVVSVQFINQIIAVGMFASMGLSYYMIFHTDVLFGQNDDFDATRHVVPIHLAMINCHSFFLIFTGVNGISASIKHEFGAIALCAPWNLWTGLVLLFLFLFYFACTVQCFFNEKYKVGWSCRLAQLCSLIVILDFKIQSHGRCPIQRETFANSALPFLVSCCIFLMSLVVEVKIILAGAIVANTEDSGDLGDEDQAKMRDSKLHLLLLSIFSFDYFSDEEARKKKAESGPGDANPFSEGLEMPEGRRKRRQQIIDV